MQSTPDKPLLGFLAGRVAREETYKDALHDFIKDYKDVLANYHLLVTGGTSRDIFNPGVRPTRYPDLYRNSTQLRPGKAGGLVELCGYVRDRKCNTIIFITDPQDAEENFPENRELFRTCAMEGATLLTTLYSAKLWASNEAIEPRGDVVAAKQGDTIALIAHDAKKLRMCHFVVKYRDQLAFFDRIMATGKTGESVRDFLDLFGDLGGKVQVEAHGPGGGDVFVSNEILRGRCQHVVFFLDPETAHPHEADIYALFRVCTCPDTEVNLRMTYHAAESWIEKVPSR